MNAILIFFHCHANTGYAIAPLERIFFEVAEKLFSGDWSRIHVAYPSLDHGWPTTMPENFKNVIVFDAASTDVNEGEKIKKYLTDHGVDVAFGFDQPVQRVMYRYLREGGIKKFFSYWGAPMSSINSGVRLWAKKIEVALSRKGPDHYIFESCGMQKTAVYGRGISAKNTSVVYLGIDPDVFYPDENKMNYVYENLGIEKSRSIFFYAGHMEERKGVRVLVLAAKALVEEFGNRGFHLLILGNKDGQEAVFEKLIESSEAKNHVTFGGYRSDVKEILKGCYAGLIASTGWDSFPRTSVEMASSGLPLIVSDLAGLNETVENGVTGYVFPVGDARALATEMRRLLLDKQLRNKMSEASRSRVLEGFTIKKQIEKLVDIVGTVCRS